MKPAVKDGYALTARARPVVVDPRGKAQSAKLRTDETKNPELVKCLEGVLKMVEWPKPTEKVGKTSVEWTLGT